MLMYHVCLKTVLLLIFFFLFLFLLVVIVFFFFFFFQAEDGIRDPLVTGVQTCALPISFLSRARARRAPRRGATKVRGLKPAVRPPQIQPALKMFALGRRGDVRGLRDRKSVV